MAGEIVVNYDKDSSRIWSEEPEINLLVIRNVVNVVNDRLNTRGHVFLNEIFDELGLSRKRDGQLIGWLKGSRIDVGVSPSVDGVITLEFNVDGKILDHLEEL